MNSSISPVKKSTISFAGLFAAIVIFSAVVAGCGSNGGKTVSVKTDTTTASPKPAGKVEAATNTDPAPLPGYKIFQSLKLKDPARKLIIEIDSQVKGLGGKLNYDQANKVSELQLESDPVTWAEDVDKYKKAILVLLSENGNILYKETFERAFARIDSVKIDNQNVLMLTVDYTAEMGSYNGPITWFIRAGERDIRYLADKKSFMHSLKSGWAIRSNSGSYELLSKKCSPFNDSPDDDKFYITFVKYTLKNGDWQLSSKKKAEGMWEDEGDLSSFLDGF